MTFVEISSSVYLPLSLRVRLLVVHLISQHVVFSDNPLTPLGFYIDFCRMNLYELIKKNNFQGFSIPLIRRFAFSILQCLKVLQKDKIIHCDLKPVSIVLMYRTVLGVLFERVRTNPKSHSASSLMQAYIVKLILQSLNKSPKIHHHEVLKLKYSHG